MKELPRLFCSGRCLRHACSSCASHGCRRASGTRGPTCAGDCSDLSAAICGWDAVLFLRGRRLPVRLPPRAPGPRLFPADPVRKSVAPPRGWRPERLSEADSALKGPRKPNAREADTPANHPGIHCSRGQRILCGVAGKIFQEGDRSRAPGPRLFPADPVENPLRLREVGAQSAYRKRIGLEGSQKAQRPRGGHARNHRVSLFPRPKDFCAESPARYSRKAIAACGCGAYRKTPPPGDVYMGTSSESSGLIGKDRNQMNCYVFVFRSGVVGQACVIVGVGQGQTTQASCGRP